MRFPFPAAFAWELYRAVCGDVPEQSPFAPEVLTWRIVGVLAEVEGGTITLTATTLHKGEVIAIYSGNKKGFGFLDVREPSELEELGTLEGYVNIPLGQIEKRLSEIPKDKAIITA